MAVIGDGFTVLCGHKPNMVGAQMVDEGHAIGRDTFAVQYTHHHVAGLVIVEGILSQQGGRGMARRRRGRASHGRGTGMEMENG